MTIGVGSLQAARRILVLDSPRNVVLKQCLTKFLARDWPVYVSHCGGLGLRELVRKQRQRAEWLAPLNATPQGTDAGIPGRPAAGCLPRNFDFEDGSDATARSRPESAYGVGDLIGNGGNGRARFSRFGGFEAFPVIPATPRISLTESTTF